MKQCPKCQRELAEDQFHLARRPSWNGRQRWCKDCQKNWRKAHRLKLKLAAFDAYGGRQCACCGEATIEFLTIDHIHGGGNEHRRQIRTKEFYGWLKRNDYPPGFQVLCMNCNFAVGHSGRCPHANAARSNSAAQQTADLKGPPLQ